MDYTPLKYYQGGNAIDGVNWEWFAWLFGATVFFAILAWWRFQKRDIRVGGEGGWRIPILQTQREKKAAI